MSHLNSYTEVEFAGDCSNTTTPPDHYDHHFLFPVITLKSDRVQLRPFVPSLHADRLLAGVQQSPDLQDWLPCSIDTYDQMHGWLERNRRDPSFCYYAIYTKPVRGKIVAADEYVFAGGIAMQNVSKNAMSAELGYILILPEYQRTHVLSHAAGILLHRMLDHPQEGGLGLRRCEWITHDAHVRSQRAAERLGFVQEGLLRSHRMLPPGKRGTRPGRVGVYEDRMARDSWIASITWEDWEEAVRSKIDGQMRR